MEGIVRGRRAEIAFSVAPRAKLDFRLVTKGSSDFIKRARGGLICLESSLFVSPFFHSFTPREKVYAFDDEKQKHLRYFNFLFVVSLRFTDLCVEKYCEN